MCYPRFHDQGLCTSSGVVEAGCKVAIGTRLKRAGMHWTVRGYQCHHRAALLQTQRAIPRFLGTPVRTAPGRLMIRHFAVVRPAAAIPQP